MEGLERIVREHPFFAGLKEEFCQLISGCAKNVRFEAGQYLFHEGEAADQFYILRSGRVALQMAATTRSLTIQTVGEDEIVGASWLVTPYRWGFDAKALELTRAISMDAACLRGKCEGDHDLGYEMMKRFAPVLIQRLQAARLQILDVYGTRN
ncbi:MAG: Crp/Fnr family transcriptional regulator [Alphaproteobacteria bacterium]|nr:Crp/Fnr family transcriptional regulator [Alphaproteobacteria bacterium]MDE2111259.1 Crp/Fnr family transcriptional regulator [Alphaproteobacteria bacterium]MDE2492565.1 Crp/Fnr family transcriptional regulator [Alphaproteobacteria bacterium]